MSSRLVALLAFAAATFYSAFVLSVWLPTATSPNRSFISELEAPGQPWNWLYRSADVAAGVALALLGIHVCSLAAARLLARAGLLLVLAGVCSVADGATAMRCDPATDAACAADQRTPIGMIAQLTDVHTESGVGGLLGLCGAALLLGVVLLSSRAAGIDRARKLMPSRATVGRVSLALGVAIGVSGLADIVVLLCNGDIGLVERARTLLSSTWLALLGYWLWGMQRAGREDAKSPEGLVAA